MWYSQFLIGQEDVDEHGMVDVYEFPTEELRQRFLAEVGGLEHPLGGLRAILSTGDEDEGEDGGREYEQGQQIRVEVGDRIKSSYGTLWVTGTGVVGDLWTSDRREDVESGRGRGLRFRYVNAIQKGGRGPWYPVDHEDEGFYTVTVGEGLARQLVNQLVEGEPGADDPDYRVPLGPAPAFNDDTGAHASRSGCGKRRNGACAAGGTWAWQQHY